MSELSFKYEVLLRMINFDETHHPLSTEGDKGGRRALVLTNESLPRSGSRIAKDPGRHTTGVYGSTPLEPMPPIFIFDSKAKDAENARVKASWCANLPVITGRWGFDEDTTIGSHVAARKKGSMDEDLYKRTLTFYKSL